MAFQWTLLDAYGRLQFNNRLYMPQAEPNQTQLYTWINKPALKLKMYDVTKNPCS
jgi:hypothetical protein